MNLDTKLRSTDSGTPRRELRADFTQTITEHIKTHPRKRLVLNPKELFMKLLDKPAMAVAGLVVTMAVSGTAYAAVINWPNISAMFSGEQQTLSGRIVTVDTTNCHTDNAFTITKPKEERGGPRYFEVKKESKLTNEQITQMVLGNCEQGAQSDVLLTLLPELEKNPANKGKIVGGYIDNVITAISPTGITLEADIPIGMELKHIVQRFTHIDPNVAVYYKTDKLAFNDLNVGDHVSFAYRASGSALAYSETLSPDKVNYDEQVLVSVIKNTPAVSAAIDYQKYFGSEFTEIAKCDKNPTGFCTLEEMQK